MIFDMQPKRLPDLQALCAAFLLRTQTFRCPLGERLTHLIPLRPIYAAKDLETVRRGILEIIEMTFEDFFPPAAIQIYVMGDACFIQKIMRVNDRKLRLIHQSCFRYEFGLGFEVCKFHSLMVL